MMRFLRLFALFVFLISSTSFAQNIRNIEVLQDGDNVVISFDLVGSDNGQTYNIDVKCSNNEGESYLIKPQSLSGDFKDVQIGNKKKIIWEVLNEREEFIGTNFIFLLEAHPNLKDNPIKEVANTNAAKFVAGEFSDARDGKMYKWIELGDQIWMAENLSYLPKVNPPSEGTIKSLDQNFYYVYNYFGNIVNDAKGTKYFKDFGVLYSWKSAKSACPRGWHLPNEAEWKKLTEYFMELDKEFPLINVNNLGFCDFLGGRKTLLGEFSFLNETGFWWSSTIKNEKTKFISIITKSKNSKVLKSHGIGLYPSYGISVRCIKNSY